MMSLHSLSMLAVKAKTYRVSIIKSVLSLLIKHVVIQCQKAPNFSAFHWSPHSSLVSIGQHFVNMRIVLFTEKDGNKLNDRSRPNHLIRPGCAGPAYLQ